MEIDKIKKYLSSQSDLKSAIKNLDSVGKDSCVVDISTGKVYFYFDKGLSKEEFKALMINFIANSGWEYSGKEE